MAKRDETPEKQQGRVAQVRAAYSITKEVQPRIGLMLAGIFLAVIVVFVAVGFVLKNPILWGVTGIPFAVLLTVIFFGRRVEKAAYSRLEGQLGAGANALSTLRKGWTVDPAVAVTRNQDVVHRVVGRPGIVLVAEGAPNRVGNLLANEKRKHARVAPDTPIYDVVVGDGEGQVPLRRLSGHVMKLPRNLRPAEVTEVLNRLKALSANRSQLPIPKGPLPRNAKLPPGASRPR
ncbi:protein of unknown function [Actinopolymorpha cephalotaxi]|uniref:DUF4191 domain-containing protein n=1 Tax=Actinopolymorpha cephalotaxi TaxID=504797 RepID=A0A1I2QSX8_9ACTN|nr:DUF4191 domain-containing protein [Actinopolymorpha cephalotaxi]NYH82549.1 hypothetical protein [Actinopolymorpha cephalotaxi]SFG30349.1 protein of unknown function [Actinopolymorpha cephalotaxi]